MNYSTFEICALWHWIERLFVYQADSPLMMGSIPFALLFIFFLAIYTLLKSYSRTAMMMYVICFSLFFAYKVNGMVMWMLPLTACINYAVTQEMRLHEGKARKALLTFVVLVDLTLLCYFKYTNFIIGDVVNEMFSTNFSLQSIALPVGISFYTFQAISYAVDTYPMYGSDVGAALKAGNNIRGALIGPGVHASHGMERTHYNALENTIKLLALYLI